MRLIPTERGLFCQVGFGGLVTGSFSSWNFESEFIATTRFALDVQSTIDRMSAFPDVQENVPSPALACRHLCLLIAVPNSPRGMRAPLLVRVRPCFLPKRGENFLVGF